VTFVKTCVATPFTVAMLTLASSAFCLAIIKSQHGNIVGSIITFSHDLHCLARRPSQELGPA
jgi:hypothetical protein